MSAAVRIGVGLALAAAGTAQAETRTVGPGQTYATIAAAAAAAGDGDVIEIQPGTYREAVTWRANQLTVRGVGSERPVIDMTGMTISNQKAIFVSGGADFTVENVVLTGAAVPSGNGAGIRWEGAGSLVVRNCVFRSNEDGILGGGSDPANVAEIEGNEFVDNGRGDVGYTHSVYIGEAAEVTFRGNWSHALWPGGSDVGHLFKSRARVNHVLANRLTAETTASSYEINLPQGGEAYVIGNSIEQRAGSQRIMISFADGDGMQYPASKLYVVNNTFVNEATGAATFIRTAQATAEIHVVNNLVVGGGMLVSGGVITMANNVETTEPGLADVAAYDYHLVDGSPAIDGGADPGMAGDIALAPTLQYVHPMGVEPRATAGAAIDVGAFEYGNPAAGDGAPTDGGDGGDAGDGGADAGDDDAGGGCCGSQRQAGPGSLLALAVAAVLGRRRARRRV